MFKMNGYEKQKAAAYISYMIAGSYFNKAIVRNKAQEKRLFLDYCEMPVQMQYKTEEQVIRLMDRLPYTRIMQLSELNCIVKFQMRDHSYEVCFDTQGFGNIRIIIQKNGTINISDVPAPGV